VHHLTPDVLCRAPNPLSTSRNWCCARIIDPVLRQARAECELKTCSPVPDHEPYSQTDQGVSERASQALWLGTRLLRRLGDDAICAKPEMVPSASLRKLNTPGHFQRSPLSRPGEEESSRSNYAVMYQCRMSDEINMLMLAQSHDGFVSVRSESFGGSRLQIHS
jgi:hypothetical protein